MKKFFYLLLLIVLLPANIYAKTLVNDCYMDVNVKSNGDILVKELWYLQGNYTDLKRTINMEDDFSYINYADTSLYDADDIEVLTIQGIPIDKNLNFNSLATQGTKFLKTESNLNSEYGTYQEEKYTDSIVLDIYNPAKYQQAFYIEYRIKNKVVKHNDIAEVNLNLIDNEFKIDHFEMKLKVENSDTLKVYLYHFKSTKIKMISSNEAKIKLSNLEEAINIGFVFDLEAVPESIKYSNLNISQYLDTDLETFFNLFNMNHQISQEETKMTTMIEKIIYIWLLGIIILLINFIINNYQVKKDYNKIPSKDDPSLVNYLIKGKVTSNSLLATIISLISEEKIILKKEDNQIKLFKGRAIPNPVDEKVIQFIFEEDSEMTIDKIKEKMKKYPAKASEELGSFYSRIIVESNVKNYYESKILNKAIKILYSFVGIILGIILMMMTYQKSNLFYMGLIVVVVSILMDYIVAKNKVKTKKGKTEFYQWLGLKSHLKKYTKNIENENLKNKIYAIAIILGVDRNLQNIFDVKLIEEFRKEYNQKINKKINQLLNYSHKIDAGISSENTTRNTEKINYRGSEKNEKNI